jgi:hypothetical protein
MENLGKFNKSVGPNKSVGWKICVSVICKCVGGKFVYNAAFYRRCNIANA